MKIVLLVLLALAGFGLAYVRLAPSDPARWHADPLAAADPGRRGVLLVPPAAPVFPETPAALMTRLNAAILAQRRARRLAGTPEDGHVTYVVRTKWIGFPDYVSAKALPVSGGATLAIFARSRFGGDDWGVNRARLDRWLEALEPVP